MGWVGWEGRGKVSGRYELQHSRGRDHMRPLRTNAAPCPPALTSDLENFLAEQRLTVRA